MRRGWGRHKLGALKVIGLEILDAQRLGCFGFGGDIGLGLCKCCSVVICGRWSLGGWELGVFDC